MRYWYISVTYSTVHGMRWWGFSWGVIQKEVAKTLLCSGIEEVPARGDFLACEIKISQRGDAVWPGLR